MNGGSHKRRHRHQNRYIQEVLKPKLDLVKKCSQHSVHILWDILRERNNMGEDVAVDIAQSKNSAGIDETDKTSTIISSTSVNIESQVKDNSLCCSAMQPPQQFNERNSKTAETTATASSTTTGTTRKWFHFSSRRSSRATTAAAANEMNSSNNNRHSWHLNDSLEMWVLSLCLLSLLFLAICTVHLCETFLVSVSSSWIRILCVRRLYIEWVVKTEYVPMSSPLKKRIVSTFLVRFTSNSRRWERKREEKWQSRHDGNSTLFLQDNISIVLYLSITTLVFCHSSCELTLTLEVSWRRRVANAEWWQLSDQIDSHQE